ncbi:MAG: NAD(P)-dependent oxidoreductase [Streptosporangiaceae bacterium]
MSEQDPAAVGLCGLGNMGSAVASRLAAARPVVAYDPDGARATAVVEAYGLTRARDLAEVAAAGTVVLSLPAPAISQQEVEALVPSMRPGGLIIETSTVNPADMWRMRAACEERSVRLVDAAILSGVQQMYDGCSTLLVGGADEDVELARPVLDALTPRQVRFGPVGSGMAAKVINNAVAHAVMVVLVEAGAMAAATGVPGEAIVDLLSGPEAGLTRPLTHRFAERILRGDYEGGMPTEAARKDSVLALELARDSGVPLFATQAAHTVYEIAAGGDLAREDYASIAKLWEEWTGRPLAAPLTIQNGGGSVSRS